MSTDRTISEVIKDAQKSKEEVLQQYLLSAWHSIGSFLALMFSAALSAFGVYPIIKSSMGGDSIVVGLLVFLVILAIVDSIKRKFLVKAYNAETRRDILQEFSSDKVGNNIWKYKTIFYFAFAFTLMFDILGVISTANYVENRVVNSDYVNSLEYKRVQSEVEMGLKINENYNLDLASWEQDRDYNSEICDEKYQRYKAKYKAECKAEWLASNPKPTRPHTTQGITKSESQKIKKDSESILTHIVWWAVIVLGTFLAVFLQSTTVSSLQDANEDVRNSLTSDIVALIRADIANISRSSLIEGERISKAND